MINVIKSIVTIILAMIQQAHAWLFTNSAPSPAPDSSSTTEYPSVCSASWNYSPYRPGLASPSRNRSFFSLYCTLSVYHCHCLPSSKNEQRIYEWLCCISNTHFFPYSPNIILLGDFNIHMDNISNTHQNFFILCWQLWTSAIY